jgi:perosamine synthetase
VVTYFGARPVLCDSVPGGFNIDPTDAEARITEKTCAIIPVHIAGEPCDLDSIHDLAKRHNLHVIEDAAHALPAAFHGQRIGRTSELTAFSFYATKTITTGEGGMLVTDNDEFAQRASRMRLHGISGDAWKRYSREGSWYYEVLDAGYKANLCDLLAALGSAQLAKCDHFARRRRSIAELYRSAFAGIEELELPPVPRSGIEHSWHLFILRIRPEWLYLNRNQFVEELKRCGISSSVHFIPLHLHPFYKNAYGYKPGDFPNAEEAYSRCLSLPIFPDMSSTEMDRVVHSVCDIVCRNRKPFSVAA